jgi:hypothetical protein
MTQDNANSVTVGGEPLVSAARFNVKPLMAQSGDSKLSTETTFGCHFS